MGSRLGAIAVAGLLVIAACTSGDGATMPPEATSTNRDVTDVGSGFVGDYSDNPRIRVLDETQQADMTKVVWHKECPLPLTELRSVAVPYVDFQGAEREGNVVVHHKIAEATLKAFETLFDERFPLAHVKPLEQFGGDFRAAMSGNNTFAFECRRAIQPLTATSEPKWSAHAYGVAIDINPLQNPHVAGDIVTPIEGETFLNRENKRPGMLIADTAVVNAFKDAGFSWSGDRKEANPDLTHYDYQHFTYTDSELSEFYSH